MLTLKGYTLTLHQTSQIICMHDDLTIPAIGNHMFIKILNAIDHPTKCTPPTCDKQLVPILPQRWDCVYTFHLPRHFSTHPGVILAVYNESRPKLTTHYKYLTDWNLKVFVKYYFY